MKNKKRKHERLVVVCIVISLGVVLNIWKPWYKTINQYIISDDLNTDWNQEVYLLGSEEKEISNPKMVINFVTFIPDWQEVQFGYAVRRKAANESFDYVFKLSDGDDYISEGFSVIPETGFINTYYRVMIPVQVDELTELHLEIFDNDDNPINTIVLMENEAYMQRIEYDYSDGDYVILGEEK